MPNRHCPRAEHRARAGAVLNVVSVQVPFPPTYEGTVPRKKPAAGRCQGESTLLPRRGGPTHRRDIPVPTTATLLDGPVAEALYRHAGTTGIDLVIMTVVGAGPWTRLWLGSVADELVRRLPMPLLLLRPQEPTPALGIEPAFRHILIPLDGSDAAEQILEPAVALGKLMQAEYTLLRVAKPAVSARPAPPVGPTSEFASAAAPDDRRPTAQTPRLIWTAWRKACAPVAAHPNAGGPSRSPSRGDLECPGHWNRPDCFHDPGSPGSSLAVPWQHRGQDLTGRIHAGAGPAPPGPVSSERSTSMKGPQETQAPGPLILSAATAAELMTPNPVSISQDATVKEAASFLPDRGLSAFALIDEAGRLVGVLSRADIVVHHRQRARYVPAIPDYYEKTELTMRSGESLPSGFQVESVDQLQGRTGPRARSVGVVGRRPRGPLTGQGKPDRSNFAWPMAPTRRDNSGDVSAFGLKTNEDRRAVLTGRSPAWHECC